MGVLILRILWRTTLDYLENSMDVTEPALQVVSENRTSGDPSIRLSFVGGETLSIVLGLHLVDCSDAL